MIDVLQLIVSNLIRINENNIPDLLNSLPAQPRSLKTDN